MIADDQGRTSMTVTTVPHAGLTTDAAPETVSSGVVSTQRLGGCVIVRLVGEFDVTNALALQRMVCDLAASEDVVIDLSRTSLLASPALRALAAAHDRAARCLTSVQVTGARGALRQLLRRSRLDARLDYHEDLADALEAALEARDTRKPTQDRSAEEGGPPQTGQRRGHGR